MEKALLKVSHETYWLLPGYLLALEFREGWVCSRIRSREFSRLKPFSIGTPAIGGNLAAGWNTIVDANNRRYLEPHEEGHFIHSFFGVNKPKCKIYHRYPSDTTLGSLKGIELTLTDDWGYVDGDSSPYEGPYSQESEIITVKERYPAFQAHNPLSDAMTNVLLSFEMYKYTYVLLKDVDLIKDILLGKRVSRKYTVGRAEPMPATCPNWLKKQVGPELLAQTLGIMKEGS